MENEIYVYEVFSESWGVVLATSKEEAAKKVREAYKKHGWEEEEEHLILIIEKEKSGWFSDCPDVIEVF